MKISKLWLDKFFDAPLPGADVLSDALTFHAFEIDGIDKVGSDDVLDVKVTPNRGHDCLSHRGIAKELSAILKVPLTHDPFREVTPSKAKESPLEKKTDAVTVKIDTPLCKRYIAGYIKGVKVGPSPKWLKERLEAIGQRSINNVVDATNFVMFNTGQPLHAFDAGKLGSLDIGVRAAKDGEVLIALDKKEYTLNSSMLVITAADKAVGIAGVKGGMPAAIDESTTDIVIESANFDGVSVRKTASALKLRTDASSRYEQGISPELCARGMEGMMEFIAHQIGGTIEGFVDIYPEPQKPMYANVTVEKVNQILGTHLTGADVADVFTRLGFGYKEEQGVFEVQIPPERLDITIAEDLVEEVVRIIGYDAIKGVQLPPIDKKPEVNKDFYWSEKIREFLVSRGFSEVFTSVFRGEGKRIVLNKIDGIDPYLRDSLRIGMALALEKNSRNLALLNLKDIKLFEIGTIFEKDKEEVRISLGIEEGKRSHIVESTFKDLCTNFGISDISKVDVLEYGNVFEFSLNNFIRALPDSNTVSYDNLPLSTTEKYKTFSKYPYVVRDIAMWLPTGNTTEEYWKIIDICFEEGGELLQDWSLVDTFEKGDKKSVAFRLIFQSFDRTLTEAEVNTLMEKIYSALKAKGFEIR